MAYIPDLGNIETFVRAVGYPGLFAAVFAETGIFFMFFLPGSSMLFTAGLLASHGIFNVWVLLPLITFAAILGDSTGYWFGTKVGPALFKREDSRFFRKSHVEKTRAFYEKHGVLAIVLARFVPIVRTFAPILAGVAGMRYRTFLTYNIAGGILWGAGITFSGYFLGQTFPQVDHYITPIILVIIITSFIPLLKEWYKHYAKKTEDTAV
ncbi:MAG: VTT domain-containing protein [bacterium]|nr:VTT domain-containing protein [bacterium]